MSLTVIAIVIALPVLLMCAAVVGSSEASLFSLTYSDRVRLARLAPRSAAAVAKLLGRPADLLVSLLFTNMMFITLFFVLTSMLLAEAAEAGKMWLGVLISIVDLLAMMVFAEIAAKMLAVRRRVEVARINAIPVLWLVRTLAPVRRVVVPLVIEPMTRLFLPPGGDHEHQPRLTTDELALLLHVGEEEGAIDSDEQRVLRQVVHLGELRVRDAMTPRVEMEWIHDSATLGQVADLARRKRLTRIPVCRGSLDEHVAGMLDVKRYLTATQRVPPGAPAPPMLDYLDPVHYVPERASLDRLLEQLRAWGAKHALCVDEHGTIVGVVSARDVVRQITAELSGETSEEAYTRRARAAGEGRWVIPGRYPVRDLTRMFDLRHDPRVSTVAGLVLSMLGRLPQPGDSVRLGNVVLTVESVTGRVVDEVRAEIAEEAAA